MMEKRDISRFFLGGHWSMNINILAYSIVHFFEPVFLGEDDKFQSFR